MANDMILRPTNFEELFRFAEIAAKSTFVPIAYRNKPEDILLAIQMGSELGLAPVQALQNIAVINGRPSIWGDAMLALVIAHPECESVEEIQEETTAVCRIKRRGKIPVERRFSMADAQRAGLLTKDSPWKTYPQRMLQMRARGFALRDSFPDVLRGLISSEEAGDYTVIEHRDSEKPAAIPVTKPQIALPENDPVAKIRLKLAATTTVSEVEKVAASVRRGMEKAAREKRPVPAETQAQIDNLIAQFLTRRRDDEAAVAATETPVEMSLHAEGI